jgi:hypothetical protein
MYMPSDLELMAQDLAEMEQQALADKQELDQLRQGLRIVVPVDLEHARTMFKLSCYYLKQHDPEFNLDLVWEI